MAIAAPQDANYTLSIGKSRLGNPEPTIHILGCSERESRALGHELVAILLRMTLFQARDLSGRSIGIPHVNSYAVTIEIVHPRDVNGIVEALIEAVKHKSGRPPQPPKLNLAEPGSIPKPGQHIYVKTSLYLDHGEDDFQGGIATVKAVKEQMSAGQMVPFVEIHERPGSAYNWPYLAAEQKKLEREFGLRWSHPDPDRG